MAREAIIYELALQQTVVLTVRASEHLPDPSLVTACFVEAIDHSDDSTETWPASIAEATSVAVASTAPSPTSAVELIQPADPALLSIATTAPAPSSSALLVPVCVAGVASVCPGPTTVLALLIPVVTAELETSVSVPALTATLAVPSLAAEIYSTELTAAVAGVALEMRTAWPALSTTV